MKMRKSIYYFSILSIVVSLLSSCYSMDDNYEWLVKDGPIVYLNKADTVVALGGKEAIRIKWFKQWDSRSTSAKIFWNGNKDSVEIDLSKNPTECIIKPLQEGVYSFNLCFYNDSKGLKSCGTSFVGQTYGSSYESLLFNRNAKLLSSSSADEIQIEFPLFAVKGYVASELVYQDNNDAEKIIKVTSKEKETIRIPKAEIANMGLKAVLKYRALYIPEPEGFDEIFYTVWDKINLPE